LQLTWLLDPAFFHIQDTRNVDATHAWDAMNESAYVRLDHGDVRVVWCDGDHHRVHGDVLSFLCCSQSKCWLGAYPFLHGDNPSCERVVDCDEQW